MSSGAVRIVQQVFKEQLGKLGYNVMLGDELGRSPAIFTVWYCDFFVAL